MADNNQTILVKKADGTFVRMALSDLKKPGSTKPESTPTQTVVPSPPHPPKPAIVQSVIKSAPIQPTKISPPKSVVSSMSPKMTSVDAVSLLEEPELHHSSAPTSTSSTREDEVGKIFTSLGFAVLPAFTGRMRSVILQRFKDIRGENETRELVLKPTTEGGLGLSAGQADILEQKCSMAIEKSIVSSSVTAVEPLKTREMRDKVLQKFAEAELPSNITPFNAFVHAPAFSKPKPLAQPNKVNPIIKTSLTTPVKPREETFKISTESKQRPIMQDVTARPHEMGPMEEIRYFRLLDLRRLASQPAEAVGRLKQKFINLREESIVLFFDALEAWHQSPLYIEYVQMVSRAFSAKTKLAANEAGKDNITLNEIKLLVAMEKELGL